MQKSEDLQKKLYFTVLTESKNQGNLVQGFIRVDFVQVIVLYYKNILLELNISAFGLYGLGIIIKLL